MTYRRSFKNTVINESVWSAFGEISKKTWRTNPYLPYFLLVFHETLQKLTVVHWRQAEKHSQHLEPRNHSVLKCYTVIETSASRSSFLVCTWIWSVLHGDHQHGGGRQIDIRWNATLSSSRTHCNTKRISSLQSERFNCLLLLKYVFPTTGVIAQILTLKKHLSHLYSHIYSHMAMGRKDVLRYSMMSLCRKGGKVAKVEIMV